MEKIVIIGLSILCFISCGTSKKDKEREENMRVLDNFIESQVQSGDGERYQNLDEWGRAMEQKERMQQQQGLYQRIQCSSCGGHGQYYDNRGQLMTCPTCGGYGYVNKYN